jgi:hypothetical protein
VGPLSEAAGTIAEAQDFRKANPNARVMVSFLSLPLDPIYQNLSAGFQFTRRLALPLHTAEPKRRSA